jgi:hypothetical protein
VRKKLVEEAWIDYRTKVLDQAGILGAVQLQETRRAFYAGANGLFAAILNILEPGEEATDKDLAVMDDIQAEFVAFSERIKVGTA